MGKPFRADQPRAPVSYTHLDVYKRQRQSSRALLRLGWAGIDSALRIPDWNELRSGVDLNALIAPVARHVVMADGGQLTTSSGTGDEAALSITYPLLS